jgi:hypothetical protein
MGGSGAFLKQTKQSRSAARHHGRRSAGPDQLFLNGAKTGMLFEDNPLKIVGARTGTPLPPHLRLETSDSILL